MSLKRSLWTALFAISMTTFVITGCESEDANKIAKAQECFDGLSEAGAPAEADACLAHIAGMESEEANALKCGLLFWKGGLRMSDIVAAFTAYENANSANKESALIELLSLGSTGADVTNAQNAYAACRKSGSPGLIYIASLVQIATIGDVAAGGAADANDLIDSCEADLASCATPAMGEILVNLSEVYCAGSSADNQVCESIETAIQAAGPGNYQGIINQFLAQIDPIP